MELADYLAAASIADELKPYMDGPPIDRPWLDKRVAATYRQYQKKQKLKRARNRAAVLLLVGALSVATLFATSAAFRQKVLDLFFREGQGYVVSGTRYQDYELREMGLFYLPNIPEGYAITGIEQRVGRIRVYLTRSDGATLTFEQLGEGQTISHDSDHGPMREIVISGTYQGWVRSSMGQVMVTWTQDGYQFVLVGDEEISEEVAIEIAGSVHKI